MAFLWTHHKHNSGKNMKIDRYIITTTWLWTWTKNMLPFIEHKHTHILYFTSNMFLIFLASNFSSHDTWKLRFYRLNCVHLLFDVISGQQRYTKQCHRHNRWTTWNNKSKHVTMSSFLSVKLFLLPFREFKWLFSILRYHRCLSI